jgi:murein DD-endopeptidase MepM/ murein hydrolase activator NlpD
MNGYNTPYPVKIVSRSATISRLRKVRLSWLAIGLTFSYGCVSALLPISYPSDLMASVTQHLGFGEIEVAAIDPSHLKASAPLEDIVGAAPNEVTPPPPPVAQKAKSSRSKLQLADNFPQDVEFKVKRGDSLQSLLDNTGISADEAKNAFDAIRKVFNPRKLDVGSVINVKLDKDKSGNVIVREFKMPASQIATVELTRTQDDQFSARKINAPLTKKLARAGGEINSSIYQTGADAGIPPAMLNEIINAYSYDVDFQRDVKKGDAIDVLFERMETPNGSIAGNGNIVFAELSLGNRMLKVFRYTDKYGNADFYNEKGESIRKALLRTPINGARITSSYGMREHPLLGYTRMHKGVDFGAPTGTPIYAAGDGVVAYAGGKSGYGNYLKIQHNSKYASAYAHLSRYASGISPGKHVKQGQIIAYVGMTGAATGPHLHYEILVNNEQVNPANVKFKTGNVLQGKDLLAFRQNMNKIESRLASVGRGQTVAMASDDKRKATD